jgi:flagellar L-ring protein precursor FlgH
MRQHSRALLLGLCSCFAVFSLGCAKVKQVIHPPREPYQFPEYNKPSSAPSASLFSPGRPGLFEDARARQVGDILVIVIDEEDSAARDASTDLSRNGEANLGVPSSLGILTALQEKYPRMNPAALLGYASESSFQGKGQKTRSGSLSATLPVQVRRVMPNGDLYVEGGKKVRVDSETHSLYLRGIVRVSDVRADDSVPSSRVAGADIEYTGFGDVSDQQRPGWLARILTKIWPF